MRATKVDKVDKGRHNSKLFKRGGKNKYAHFREI
jgi:hypothetical protein|nr:MAG TPA: hypothetical protein [Caudoviricetes sp.]DAW84664.1 MAG TPA: hypothetical protein [Bacteriophage sp.]